MMGLTRVFNREVLPTLPCFSIRIKQIRADIDFTLLKFCHLRHHDDPPVLHFYMYSAIFKHL
jgi:hypothetical protein